MEHSIVYKDSLRLFCIIGKLFSESTSLEKDKLLLHIFFGHRAKNKNKSNQHSLQITIILVKFKEILNYVITSMTKSIQKTIQILACNYIKTLWKSNSVLLLMFRNYNSIFLSRQRSHNL